MDKPTQEFITPQASRALRVMLAWERRDLSDASGVGIRTVEKFEAGDPVGNASLEKLAHAFRAAGASYTVVKGVAVLLAPVN